MYTAGASCTLYMNEVFVVVSSSHWIAMVVLPWKACAPGDHNHSKLPTNPMPPNIKHPCVATTVKVPGQGCKL